MFSLSLIVANCCTACPVQVHIFYSVAVDGFLFAPNRHRLRSRSTLAGAILCLPVSLSLPIRLAFIISISMGFFYSSFVVVVGALNAATSHFPSFVGVFFTPPPSPLPPLFAYHHPHNLLNLIAFVATFLHSLASRSVGMSQGFR